jgi:phosphate transport system permease protein
MHATKTFTGRARRRNTHPWVKASDRVARLVITAGGIGTIIAVLGVGVFLLLVAAPLFAPARGRLDAAAPLAGVRVGALGADESGSLAWFVARGGADDGAVHVVGVSSGTTLLSRAAGDTGLAGCTAIRVPAGDILAAVGFADGSYRTGRLGLDSAYQVAGTVPAAANAVAGDAATVVDGGVVVQGDEGRLSRVTLVTELGPAAPPLGAAIVDCDVAPLAAGPLSAFLDAAGRVRVEATSSKRNMLTGKMTSTSSGATIEPVAGFRPAFVRVSALGDQLFLIAPDGAGRRYVIRDVSAPVLAESFAAAADGAEVTAVERLFGGSALAVGDDAGRVRVLFTARTAAGEPSTAADGLRVVVAREFAAPPSGAAVSAIAASPRSRLFAVSDVAGRARLLHSTAGSEVTALPGTGSAVTGAQTLLCISPREDHVLAAMDGGLATWKIAPGYPEVSFRSLLLPVWYESYPAPTFAWETTGHEAFESKFGLVPLIFGTIKATIYSMLFATPIAILAAIYASQFMHPRWKARIKPTIEMMASLPSVVLGFIAGLVFAPLVERSLMPIVTGLFGVPLVVLLSAHLWQLLPPGWRGRLAGWRFGLVGLVALPVGVIISWAAAPVVERLLFRGDIGGWLDGRDGSGFGGWVIAMLPLAALAATLINGRFVNPWLRRSSAGWSSRGAAVAAFASFLAGVVFAVAIAVAAAVLLDALRLDTRGGLFGTYVQRNALIVAIGMSFAIIPLVFTIADDAISSVPDHLRSASLGAGATPWQTAVRVIVPAAASGIFSAVMIGLGRAVGETMIVLMAAGNTPLIGWNIFNGFQTLSAAIATELPEAARGSTHYRVLFLAALSLFAITFVVNTAAEIVRQRFRRRAHEL